MTKYFGILKSGVKDYYRKNLKCAGNLNCIFVKKRKVLYE